MGRLLLTLLVITGLAGTLNNTALTKSERQHVVNSLKDTRNDLVNSLKGLSENQLNFKAAPDRWSIKECLYHITLTENNLWAMLETSMKQPPAPEKRSEIKVTDEGLEKGVTDRSQKFKAADINQPGKASWKSASDALADFKTARAAHLKYAKTTTEDLRNHVVQMPFGLIDCYQLMLMISGHCERHTLQINEVKADPKFPKK